MLSNSAQLKLLLSTLFLIYLCNIGVYTYVCLSSLTSMVYVCGDDKDVCVYPITVCTLKMTQLSLLTT